jgi:hypothetical protein
MLFDSLSVIEYILKDKKIMRPKLIGSRFPAVAGLKGYNRLKTFMILIGIQNIPHNPMGGPGLLSQKASFPLICGV